MPANLQFLETSKLKIHPDNPRTHDETSIKEIARSIKKLGFRAPIYVWKDGIIVAGAGRYLAAKRLRIPILPCIVDEDMDEATAMEYMVADNKTAEFSGQDDVKLVGLIKAFSLADIPGFTSEQLAAIVSVPVPVLPDEKPVSTTPSVRGAVRHLIQCPNCSFEFTTTDKATTRSPED